MIMLGIDPGLRIAGYSVITQRNGATVLLECGYLSLPQQKSIPERIGIFYDFFAYKIKTWQVTDICLETSFLGKNAQNFLKLGYLRGIVYLLSNQNNLVLHEYAPREIKQAITGFGGASKEQVAHILLKLFPGLQKPKKEDVTDALAIGLCGMWKKNQKRI